MCDSFRQGEQFAFYEDWGETLVSKSAPVLCVLDIEGNNVSVLEGLPEDISPGQVCVCVAFSLNDYISMAGHLFAAFLSLPCRPSGLQGTLVWCLWAGGTSLSDLDSSSAPTGGERFVLLVKDSGAGVVE